LAGMGLTNIQESFSHKPQHPSAGQCTIACSMGCDSFTTNASPTYGVLQVADGLLIMVDLYNSGISYIIFVVCDCLYLLYFININQFFLQFITWILANI
jgi:hypothetical protein